MIRRHDDLLDQRTVWAHVEVKDRHRRKRAAWQHENSVHRRTRVARASRSNIAGRRRGHRRANARAARRVARVTSRRAQRWIIARAAARRGRTRHLERGAQADALAAREVHLRELVVGKAVDRHVVRRVARRRCQIDVKVHRTLRRVVHDADVDKADRCGHATVGPQTAKIVVQDVREGELEAHALADARRQGRRWRWRGRRRLRR